MSDTSSRVEFIFRVLYREGGGGRGGWREEGMLLNTEGRGEVLIINLKP